MREQKSRKNILISTHKTSKLTKNWTMDSMRKSYDWEIF